MFMLNKIFETVRHTLLFFFFKKIYGFVSHVKLPLLFAPGVPRLIVISFLFLERSERESSKSVILTLKPGNYTGPFHSFERKKARY